MATRKNEVKQPKFSEELKEMADRNPELENNPVFLCLLRDAEFDEEIDEGDDDE